MDPYKNPYSPNAGAPPPELAGRDQIIEKGMLLFERAKRGRSEQQIILTGIRGVGKTVILNHIKREAERRDMLVVGCIEASEGRPLDELLIRALIQVMRKRDKKTAIVGKFQDVFIALGDFISSLNLNIEIESINTEIGLKVNIPSRRRGDLESELFELLQAVGEMAKEQKTVVGILVDEVQYLMKEEFEALISTFHKIQQNCLPVVFIGAGLPTLPKIAGDLESYSERLFQFPKIAFLPKEDARAALEKPANKEGVTYEDTVTKNILQATKGYPYFLQEWGSQCWLSCENNIIDMDVYNQVQDLVIQKLDESFYRVRFERLTPKEKEFLLAMARLGDGPHPISNIVAKLRQRQSQVGTFRINLIKKGMIYSEKHGELSFTVPMFADFMMRNNTT